MNLNATGTGITDVAGNAVWRYNPLSGAFTSFPVPTPKAFSGNVQPTGITVGPDGNIWFTENAGNKIGRVLSRFAKVISQAGGLW